MDSFRELYTPVIETKADAVALTKLQAQKAKRNVLKNERLYETCPKGP